MVFKFENTGNPIVFFDGMCNLCNRSVTFIIRHDKKIIFRFASLQSPIGQQLLSLSKESILPAESIVLYYNEKYYLRSEAIIRIAQLMGGLFKLAVILYVIPRFIRDTLYDYIARHRYRWFGKLNKCNVPDVQTADRFLS